MSYPPLPSNGETNWGNKFISWADALEGRKVEGEGMSLRRDTSVGTRVLLDHPGGTGTTMIYGDTGWRTINDLLEPGWLINTTAGSLRILRTNWLVQLSGRLQVEADAPFIGRNFATVVTLPVGYRPRMFYTPFGIASGAGTIESDGAISIIIRPEGSVWQATSSVTFNVRWDTRNNWPTSLPGTPFV